MQVNDSWPRFLATNWVTGGLRGGPSARLDTNQRAKNWERLASHKFDVLVIGGGVTGSGAALDAATRGLSVALVEARDFASGTSSRSSSCSMADCGTWSSSISVSFARLFVNEELMLRESPTSGQARIISLPAFAPFLGASVRHRGYDALRQHGRGALRTSSSASHAWRRAAGRAGLKRSALAGAVVYYDAQADDAGTP